MRVSVIKKNKISNLLLPNKVEGNYWISETDENGINKNLISIESKNGIWKIVSNNEVYCMNNEMIVHTVNLEFNKFYLIKNKLKNEIFYIYCCDNHNNFNYFKLNDYLNNSITIGKNENNYIVYELLDENSSFLKYENGFLNIYDNNSKFGIYVNNLRIDKVKTLENGDSIFILGLKMVVLFFENKDIYLGINNNIKNIKIQNLVISNLPFAGEKNFEESEEEIEYPLYSEGDYFNKTPRFDNQIKELDLLVDPPPAKIENNNNSLLITIGPMITMSMTSMVMGYTGISNAISGNTTWTQAIPSLVICGAMFSSIFIWPLVTKRYEKKQKQKNEAKRQEKYSKYIEEKRQKIIQEKNNQSSILKNNFPGLEECKAIILTPLTSLWQRKLSDHDFLEVSLGIGSCPMKINIRYPEDHFSMVEDNLKDMVSKLGNEPKVLNQVPIVFSYLKNSLSAIIGDENVCIEYMKRILVQILAHHSYDNLKVVILTDEENKNQWKDFKVIPHIFTDDRSLRFFATNNDDYKEICYYLDKLFEMRKSQFNNHEPSMKELKTAYLIITDSYKKIKNFDIFDKLFDNKSYLGFSMVILDEKITNLPEQCENIVKLTNETGELINNTDISKTIKFSFDNHSKINYHEISQKLANIPINFKNNEEGQLPEKLGFLEMFDVGKIEQLNALSRWQNSNPMINLKTPVGIGKSGELVTIDLHEKYHGPHGLIAGMTGSGKSEFIITYILSMAINYHPYEVQFILIDYKGGGLAGAFENESIGLKLPHLVGTITNLDTNEIKRSLASIESELKRRQALFNKAREISGESTIDIYKYQKMYRNNVVKEPVSHLFIISDEFAELKNQQPEFMDQLISTARIGRSLGVHLILATQKPSGVVDPQIWSNTRFRVCMRVQDKSDSNEVIKCNDAAYLKQTGRFYFQVGYNEVFILGQAAWAGGKYVPMDKVNKTIDTSIDIINNVGYSIKNFETRITKKANNINNGEELLNIVKYLSSLANENGIKCNPLWLDKIPSFIKIENLAKKYNYRKEQFNINPIIGEYDVPKNQEQRLLTLPLSKEGNAVIYGSSGSGKENFITTMIYSSLLYYNPKEINYYIIDFGSETLKMFNNCPIVGNVLNVDDEERIENLYKMISATIEERKILFAEYNGSFENYCKNSGRTIPNMVIIINNFESYQETYGEYDETLTILSRECNRYGIYFIITLNTPNGLRFKLKQNFSLTYVLQQNNEEDYGTILGNIHKNYPAKIFGRGIMKTDDVYEFQIASVDEISNIPKYIKEVNKNYSKKYDCKAKSVPVLPKTVGFNEISSEFAKTKELIIGLNKNTLEICKFDFSKNFITIVSAMDLCDCRKFVNCLINQIIVVNNKSLVVINADDDLEVDDRYKPLYQYVDSKYDDIFENLLQFNISQREKYVSSNYNKEIFLNKKPIYCIIIGLDNFKKRLSDENRNKLGELFTNSKDLNVINYIIVDSIDKIRKIELDSWYKNCVSNNNGIWIGNGINDQFSLKIIQKIPEMKDDITNDFCFVITKGKANFVKYVAELDLKI